MPYLENIVHYNLFRKSHVVRNIYNSRFTLVYEFCISACKQPWPSLDVIAFITMINA